MQKLEPKAKPSTRIKIRNLFDLKIQSESSTIFLSLVKLLTIYEKGLKSCHKFIDKAQQIVGKLLCSSARFYPKKKKWGDRKTQRGQKRGM